MPDLEHVKYAITDAPVDDTILRRWSPRAFADKPVSAADLKTLFTAATWAASSQNEQPWRFILGIKPAPNAEPSETYTKLFNALVPGNQSWAKEAPVLYAAIAKKTFAKNGKPNGTAQHDLGAASATLSLEAVRLGEGKRIVDVGLATGAKRAAAFEAVERDHRHVGQIVLPQLLSMWLAVGAGCER